jgi:hypothetical protein
MLRAGEEDYSQALKAAGEILREAENKFSNAMVVQGEMTAV